MCWGRVLYCGIELFINMYYTNRIVNMKYSEQLKYTLPFMFYCMVIAAIAFFIHQYVSNDILTLIIDLTVIIMIWLLIVQKLEHLNIKTLLSNSNRH